MRRTELQNKVLAKWPEPPQTWAQSLLHTVDVFEGEPDDMPVITATRGLYGPNTKTGLTLGDLRRIADLVRWNEEPDEL